MITLKAVKKLSFIGKVRGMMFEDKISPIYFETRFGIHTMFVKNSFDLIILDNQFVVRRYISNLKPWRIFIWNPKYSRVLELPPGYIKKNHIRIGSKINITFR
jgi:uncharacterized membrane protein (UPF0127 family)